MFTEDQGREKFEKCVSKLKPAWGAAQRRKRVTVVERIARTFAVVVDVLSDVYNTLVFSANF